MSRAEIDTAAYFDRCACEGVMAEFSGDEPSAVTALLERWGIRPGQRVCEPGCGGGRLTAVLADAVGADGEVVAFDTSSAMLARAAARRLPRQVRLVRCSALAIPTEEGRFDHTVCFHALPHFPDLLAALAEMRRVLAPGGSLWVAHLSSRARVNAIHAGAGGAIGTHLIPEDPAMRRLVAAAGLRLELLGDGPAGYRLHARRPEAATAQPKK